MKVSKLRIRNLFGLKEYESDGGDRELSGDNGTGKTSLIDSIRLAFTNKSARDYVVTNGESEGEIFVETDNGITINRKVRTNKADYKSIKRDGKDVLQAERFLRELFTELQLNPVEFLSMSKNDQNRMILDMIDFKWDLNWIREQFGEIVPGVNYEQNILGVLQEIQAEDGYYFQKRQDINREARNKLAFIEEIGQALPKGYNAKEWEAVNLGEMFKKIEEIRAVNERITKAKEVVAGRDGRVKEINNEMELMIAQINDQTRQNIDEGKKRIAQLQDQIRVVEGKIKEFEQSRETSTISIKAEYKNQITAIDAEVNQYADVAAKKNLPVEDLQKDAENAEKMKSYINEYHRMTGFQKEVEGLKSQSDALTAKIEHARALPGAILEQSNIPVNGLTIKDGIPLINGLPINNLSDGEKLDLCVSVATQKENSLNMVLIDGVEKLGKTNREILYKKLKEKGVQFISTRTTDEKELTVTRI